jgi:hypothetical protein
MAMHERVKQEQELFSSSVAKVKISGANKQAKIMDVSSTGRGTIKREGEVVIEKLEEKSEYLKIVENWYFD